MAKYKEDLLREIEGLKTEHEELTKHIRPETAQLMKIKSPDEILKKETVLLTVKRIGIAVITIAVAVCLGLLVHSFMEGMSTPFVEDDSLKDSAFVPDETVDLNETGSGTGLPSIAQQGEYVYFSEDGALYKCVSGEKSRIISASATHINAYKYCLYYYDGETDSVRRVRTDGKDERVLLEGVKVRDLKVYRDTVYVLTEDGDIKSVYINGKDGYTVSSGKNILAFTVADKYIYYIVREGQSTALYRMKTAGANSVKVSDTDSAQLAAKDGYVLYIHDGTLFGFSSEKEKAFALFSGNVKEFAAFKNAIAVLAGNELYTADAVGSNVKLRAEGIETLGSISAEELIAFEAEYSGREVSEDEE